MLSGSSSSRPLQYFASPARMWVLSAALKFLSIPRRSATSSGSLPPSSAEFVAASVLTDFDAAIKEGYSVKEISQHLSGIDESEWEAEDQEVEQSYSDDTDSPGLLTSVGKGLAHGGLGLGTNPGRPASQGQPGI